MRLEKASYKAIKYACLNFHYAKAIPVNTFGFNVFNNKEIAAYIFEEAAYQQAIAGGGE